jgi:hypothetical protein
MRKGDKEVLVSWYQWPSKHNSWIKKSELIITCNSTHKTMDIRMLRRSSDSLDLYSNNQPYDFYVHLPIPLTLKGYWTVSLLEVCMFCNKKTDVYIYTNLCEDTIVGDKELPLLRHVYLKTSSLNEIFTYPYEVPTRIGQVHDVHTYIYIKDATAQ